MGVNRPPGQYHSTDECTQLKSEAKKVKASFDSNSKKGSGLPKNKMWTKKVNDAMKNNKKELSSFVKKAAKASIKAKLKATNKKCNSSSDSDNEFDLNVVNLKDFNYKDMENLNLNNVEDKFYLIGRSE